MVKKTEETVDGGDGGDGCMDGSGGGDDPCMVAALAMDAGW
jgi:hypothetical protein